VLVDSVDGDAAQFLYGFVGCLLADKLAAVVEWVMSTIEPQLCPATETVAHLSHDITSSFASRKVPVQI
jgi:hypothetical protein